MRMAKYYWDLNDKALKETRRVLRDPKHPHYFKRMVTLLSRCDRPKELFSILSKKQFIESWPKVRSHWMKVMRHSDSRDWWETLYEQLIEPTKIKSTKPKGGAPSFFQDLWQRNKRRKN